MHACPWLWKIAHAAPLSQCAARKSYVGVLAYDMAGAARKLAEDLEKYAWSQAAETLAETQEYRSHSPSVAARPGSQPRTAARRAPRYPLFDRA
jgi:ABC-type sulfate transport system substrate-binding protein